MNRKWLIVMLCAAVAIAAVAILASRRNMNKGDHYTLYIGGYGKAAVKCVFNAKSMENSISRDFKARHPSYLLTVDSPMRVYGVSESGARSGVWGYMDNSLDQSLGDVKDGGVDACYLAYFNNHLLTAGYGKGSIGVYPLDTAGNIMPASQIVNFPSAGGVSRLHMVKVLTAPQTGNNYLLATDKGCDRVYFFRIAETEKGLRLRQCDSAFISTPKGYGPRHMEFSKDGKFMYLLCETSGMILVYTIKEVDGNIILHQIQEAVSDKKKAGASADIHLSPDGKFLYSSNRRGKDGIAIFKTSEDGTITRIAYQVTLQWPRSFAISPDGDFMFVCCQKYKAVQIFRIDKSSGYLANTGKMIMFPDLEPSCILVRNN
ncbi:MAG: lactonase family protein [Bacteroidales bacterium]|nr:lactonase family protein [Bacteroidales bacterium]